MAGPGGRSCGRFAGVRAAWVRGGLRAAEGAEDGGIWLPLCGLGRENTSESVDGESLDARLKPCWKFWFGRKWHIQPHECLFL